MDISNDLIELLSKPDSNKRVILPESLTSDNDAYISKEIVIPNNVYYLQFSKQGLFKIRLASELARFVLDTSNFCVIWNLHLLSDVVNTAYSLMYIRDCQNVLFSNSTVEGYKAGQSGLLVFSDQRPSKNVVVRNSSFKSGQGDARDTLSIAVRSKTSESAREIWLSQKRAVNVTHKSENIVIRRNKIDGGYYGVSFDSVKGGFVEYNSLSNNTRGVSVQNGTEFSMIHNNLILENRSSGIHLAYGSCDNHVHFNKIISKRTEGEGCLQSYVGSKRNHFFRNDVNVNGAKWMAYCGIHSDGCSFVANSFSGNATRAVMAIESAWNQNMHIHKSHRGAEAQGFFNRGMYDVKVTNNVITATCNTGLGIFLSGTDNTQLHCHVAYNETLLDTETFGVVSNRDVDRNDSIGTNVVENTTIRPNLIKLPTIKDTDFQSGSNTIQTDKPWAINTYVKPRDSAEGYVVRNMQISRPAADVNQSHEKVQ